MINSRPYNGGQSAGIPHQLPLSRHNRRKPSKSTGTPAFSKSGGKRSRLPERSQRRDHDSTAIVPLTDAVGRVRFNIKHHEEHCNNWETNTIQYLVDPLLKALGWDFDNPLEVVREYRPDPSTEHRVDIALLENTEPFALIEVKKLNHQCTDRDLDQLEGYVSAMNKVIGILTNGEVWQIYHVFNGEIELPCQMNVTEASVSHVATTLSDFIAKAPADRKKWPRKPSRRKLTTKRIFNALMNYRDEFRQQSNKSVFTEPTARLIAKSKPTTVNQLEKINGVGPKTIANHSRAIRNIVKNGHPGL